MKQVSQIGVYGVNLLLSDQSLFYGVQTVRLLVLSSQLLRAKLGTVR